MNFVINNDESGLVITSSDEEDNKTTWLIEDGDDARTFDLLTKEQELSFVFPENAYVTIEEGKLVVSLSNYSDKDEDRLVLTVRGWIV